MNNETKVILTERGEIIFENARLMYKNFSGRKTDFNEAGNRNFCIVIDNVEDANMLNDYGYNVKIIKKSLEDPEDTPKHYIPVKIKYSGFRKPSVYRHINKQVEVLDEMDLNKLDEDYILSADVTINPYHWERNGNSGVSAYLDTMHVIVEADYFHDKYFSELPEE